MKIALDFDETITKDPEFWLAFVLDAEERGHQVLIVTARDEYRDGINWGMVGWPHEPCPVIWCDGVPKRLVMARHRITIDVWIDDNPYGILHGTSLSEKAKLAAWRETDKYRNSSRPPDGESEGWNYKEDPNDRR